MTRINWKQKGLFRKGSGGGTNGQSLNRWIFCVPKYALGKNSLSLSLSLSLTHWHFASLNYTSSVTRWLYYLSIFCHLQQWKLAQWCHKFAKVGSAFCPIRNKLSKIWEIAKLHQIWSHCTHLSLSLKYPSIQPYCHLHNVHLSLTHTIPTLYPSLYLSHIPRYVPIPIFCIHLGLLSLTHIHCTLHTYLPTNLPIYLPTNLPTNLPTYLPTNLPTYLPTYQPKYPWFQTQTHLFPLTLTLFQTIINTHSLSPSFPLSGKCSHLFLVLGIS